MVICGTALLLLAAVVDAQDIPAAATDNPSPFLSVPPAISDEFRFGAQFPEFEAKDINGRTWRTEDLRGKFTLIYLWHTFDARMRDSHPGRDARLVGGLPDLPELQRFYDKSKTRRNIQVLTFCLDYDYMHAHDYMKQKQYTFPVIADWTLIGKLFPKDACRLPCSVGIPSPSPDHGMLAGPQWVVDPQGRLSYPFRAWSFGRLLFEIEKAAN